MQAIGTTHGKNCEVAQLNRGGADEIVDLCVIAYSANSN